MKKVNNIVVLGLFTAITILLANTIGFIPIGPLAITTMHLPVIICAILYGKKMGAIMGLVFGLISLTRAYMNPSPTSFIMMNPLISVLPRLAFGYLAGLIYEMVSKSFTEEKKSRLIIFMAIIMALSLGASFYFKRPYKYLALLFSGVLLALIIYIQKFAKKRTLSQGISAVLATGLHSIMVLSSIWLLYRGAYLDAIQMTIDLVVLSSLLNMIAEMLVSGIIVPMVTSVLERGVKNSATFN